MMSWYEVCMILHFNQIYVIIMMKYCIKLCNFKNMNTCNHLKTIYHIFDIYDIEYIQILFILTITWNSCDFFTNIWKSNFQIEPMNLWSLVNLWCNVAIYICIINIFLSPWQNLPPNITQCFDVNKNYSNFLYYIQLLKTKWDILQTRQQN
jgi:hypothetical protein